MRDAQRLAATLENIQDAALHVDMLWASQLHEDCPDFGSDLVVWFDFETGQPKHEVVKSAVIEGSWDTRLIVRSRAGRVEVQGNPSKWNRPEAVAGGCATVAEGLAVFNEVLRLHGLPEFVSRPQVLKPDGKWMETGPRLQWVHIASVFSLGSADCIGPYIDWLSTQRVGRSGLPFDKKGAQSVLAGTRRRRERAIYGKGAELREAAKKWARKRKVDGGPVVEYLLALADRCDALGLMRDEVRLAGDYLVTVGLEWADAWTGETMKKQWADYAIQGGGSAAVTDWKGQAMGRLLQSGLGERAARQRLETLLAWMGGVDVSPGPGRSLATWYRIAKDLRDVLGVDIRSRPNVVTLGSRVQQLARPVEARPLTAADVRELYRGLPSYEAKREVLVRPLSDEQRAAVVDGFMGQAA